MRGEDRRGVALRQHPRPPGQRIQPVGIHHQRCLDDAHDGLDEFGDLAAL